MKFSIMRSCEKAWKRQARSNRYPEDLRTINRVCTSEIKLVVLSDVTILNASIRESFRRNIWMHTGLPSLDSCMMLIDDDNE